MKISLELPMLKQFVRFSHVGRRPIILDPKTSISIRPFNGAPSNYHTTKINREVVLKGPLGEYQFGIFHGLHVNVSPGFNAGEQVVSVSLDEDVFSTLSNPKQRFIKAMWGTTVGILSKQADGLVEGFTIPIKLVGVGYKASVENGVLVLKVGFSHLVQIPIPQDIQVKLLSPSKFILFGINYQRVTQFAAKIRSHKKPEPYNGKGIFVGDETVKRKEGKKK